MMVVRVLVFLLGAAVVFFTLFSAMKTVVLPRSAPDWLARAVFRSLRFLFNLRLRAAGNYAEKDRVMAFFGPVGVLMLLPAWLLLVSLGYSGMLWAISQVSWLEAYTISGSSLLTLGFAQSHHLAGNLLEFTEGTIGLMLVALLIAYLPTMYAAFQRRESAVTLLEVRAGSPPSAIEMLLRFHRIHGLEALNEQWRIWETWFVDIEESHTSLAALVFFRSAQPDHSWVTAAGAVLDAASLAESTLAIPHDVQAQLCIRAGYLALRRIADVFRVEYQASPQKGDPISIRREEFERAWEQLATQGLPVRTDRDQAWEDFTGWRVNYDRVLVALAGLTMAPSAPWSSDRTTNGDQEFR